MELLANDHHLITEVPDIYPDLALPVLAKNAELAWKTSKTSSKLVKGTATPISSNSYAHSCTEQAFREFGPLQIALS